MNTFLIYGENNTIYKIKSRKVAYTIVYVFFLLYLCTQFCFYDNERVEMSEMW